MVPKFIATNFEKTASSRNSSQMTLRRFHDIEIQRRELRENAVISKFIVANFEENPSSRNSSRPISRRQVWSKIPI